MNAKITVFLICIAAILYLLLNNLHDCTFKRSKVLLKSNKFQEFYDVKYFKEIKRLKSLQKAEAYLELKPVSTMELFYKCI